MSKYIVNRFEVFLIYSLPCINVNLREWTKVNVYKGVDI